MMHTKLTAAVLALALTAATAAGMTQAEQTKAAAHIRPRAAVVVEIDQNADTVTVEDSAGFLWSFPGVEEWEPGDGCILTLYDNDTPRIFDDTILNVTYERFDLLPQS